MRDSVQNITGYSHLSVEMAVTRSNTALSRAFPQGENEMMPIRNYGQNFRLSASAEFVLSWAIFFKHLPEGSVPSHVLTSYGGTTAGTKFKNSDITLADVKQMLLTNHNWKADENVMSYELLPGGDTVMVFSAIEQNDGGADLSIGVRQLNDPFETFFLMQWSTGAIAVRTLNVNQELLTQNDCVLEILAEARLDYGPWATSRHREFMTQLKGSCVTG